LIIPLWPRAAVHIDGYTDKYSYHAGDTMYVGLHIINYGDATRACL